MTGERTELSRAELAGVCATVCAGASGIGAFFVTGHATWERLLAVLFVSVAVATLLVSVVIAAKALLPIARFASKAAHLDAITSAQQGAGAPATGATEQSPRPTEFKGEGSPLHTTSTTIEQAAAPQAGSDGYAQLGEPSSTRPIENHDARPRTNRLLWFMVTRIVPATVASFGVIFAIVIITRHAPPKHLVAVLRAPGSAAATNIEFNPDGTLLATVSCSGDCGGAKGDDQVDIWNLATRHVATVFDYPGQNEFGSDKGLGFMPLLSFSPDGDSLVTTSTASPIIYLISSAPFGAKVTTFESPDGNSIEALEFSPDGKSLITTNGSENAYLWSTATRKIEAKFTDHRQYAAITSTSFSSRGTIVAFGDDKDDIYAWNFVTGTTVSIQNTAYDGVSPIGIDSLGRTLAIADGFGEIQLFSLGAEKVIATLNIPAEIFGIEAVAFSADGKIIAAAGDDGNIYFWDTATKRMIGTLADGPTSFFNPTPPELATMAFSPNGKILATDDSDGNVYIWDISWLHA